MTLFREYPHILVHALSRIIDQTWDFNLYCTETESANCLDFQICLWALRGFVLNWLTACSKPQQYLTRDVVILHHQETGASHIFLNHQQPQTETTGLSRSFCMSLFTLDYSKGQTEWSWDHELWVHGLPQPEISKGLCLCCPIQGGEKGMRRFRLP